MFYYVTSVTEVTCGVVVDACIKHFRDENAEETDLPRVDSYICNAACGTSADDKPLINLYCWGIRAQNHDTITGTGRIDEGSGNLDHLQFFNAHIRLRVYGPVAFSLHRNATAAAGIELASLESAAEYRNHCTRPETCLVTSPRFRFYERF